jgi:transposase
MPTEKLIMRKIKQILQLHHESGLSRRAIATAAGTSYGSVANYLNRANKAGICWPLPDNMDERDLGRLLFPSQEAKGKRRFTEPDFPRIQEDLKLKYVTKLLLWEEYRQAHPKDGYSYAQFCHRYKIWSQKQSLSMRQIHLAGEKLFVDYCGPTITIVNPDTGECYGAQIFVAVLGASNYTFAYASKSQKQADWIQSHVLAFEFFGGVPQLVIPDNLKSAVVKTSRYAPEINPAYQQMANHYQTAIIPARPYKPKDKAKAEVAVQIVERWILGRLRHQTFFTLSALNLAIKDLLVDLNNRAFKKLPGNRRTAFERIDKPALKPLPSQSYQYVEIKTARVHIDYHIEYDKHYYSVPHHLVKQAVEVHASSTMVSIYAYGQRVSCHPRSFIAGAHSTLTEHMPQSHRALSEWSVDRFLNWAGDIGSSTKQVVSTLLHKKRHPEQNYRSVLALLSLAKKYDRQRLEKACHRALDINSPTRTSVESILKKGRDKIPSRTTMQTEEQTELALDDHENIRGNKYYH